MSNKKEHKIISIRLDINVFNRLGAYCEETGQPRTTAMERMLNKCLAEYEKQPKGKRVPF